MVYTDEGTKVNHDDRKSLNALLWYVGAIAEWVRIKFNSGRRETVAESRLRHQMSDGDGRRE